MKIGILRQAQEAAFRQEMSEIKQNLMTALVEYEIAEISIDEKLEKVNSQDMQKWGAELKLEIISWGQYTDPSINKITKEYLKKNFENIVNSANVSDNLYYVEKTMAQDKEKTYIYDVKADILYKIPVTRIGFKKVHSVEELDNVEIPDNTVVEELIDKQGELVTVDGITHYEPNLAGFALNRTSVIYYNGDASIVVPAKEYIEGGCQRTIEVDEIEYTFYDYKNKIWGNILVENNGMKSYWVWIPRYSYKVEEIDEWNKELDPEIKFIDSHSTPEEGYVVHSAFEGGKKGIWASKYEPIQTANKVVSDFPHYIPDLTGFNKNTTYIEVYDNDTQSFKETKLSEISDISKFAKDNNWFDYNNQIWANIKVYEPQSKTESWWVWIPRYAYSITGKTTAIIFVDLNNNPIDGSDLPSNYKVHSAFEDGKKGIWVSKYEPIYKIDEVGGVNNVNPPNLVGFNVDNTYIECYNPTTNSFTEQTLRSILSNKAVISSDNKLQKMDIDFSKIKGTWYSYDKKIWANIKVVNPDTDVESWWVWIPRYAYNIIGIGTNIIWLDEEGKPTDGSNLPSNYIPHPAFNESPNGIWASKYEPIESN